MAILTDITTEAGRAAAIERLRKTAEAKGIDFDNTVAGSNSQTAITQPTRPIITIGDLGSPTPPTGIPASKILNPSYQDFSNNTSAIDSFDPNFSSARTNIGDTGNVAIDTSTPEEIANLNRSITNRVENIAGLGKKQVTKDDISRMSSLRPENQYEKDLATGVGMVKDYAMGNSQIDRTIANRLLNRFDASQGAASLAQAQRIASNPMLSEGGKQVAAAEAQRMAGSQRAELTGQLAQQSQERAFTSAEKYTQLAQTAAQYNETKFQNDFKNVTDEITREIDTLSKAGTLELGQLGQSVDMWGKRIDSMQSDAARALNAAVAIGQIDQKEADLRLDKIKEQTRMKEKEFELNLDAKRTDANSRQIDETIANLRETRAESVRTRAYGAVSDWQMLNPRNDGESADDYAARMYNDRAMVPIIRDAYYAETGQEGTVDPDWVEAFMAQHPDPASFESRSSESYRTNLIRTLSGYGMTQDAATNIANTIALGASTDGMVSRNAAGDYVYDDGINKITFGKDPKFEDSTPKLGSVAAAFINKPEGYITEIDGVVYKNTNGKPIPLEFKNNKPNDIVTSGNQVFKIGSDGKPHIFTLNINDSTSLWGSDANKIINDPNNSLFSDVVSARVAETVKQINSGDYSRLSTLKENDDVYKAVAAQITPFTMPTTYNNGGLFGRGYRQFNTPPSINSIIKAPDGTLWRVSSSVGQTGRDDPTKRNGQAFTVTNPITGEIRTVTSFDRPTILNRK